MIQRALKLRKALDLYCYVEKDFRSFLISEEDWKLINETAEFLEPFADITKHIEGFKHATLSSVVPLYNKLLDFSEDWNKNRDKNEITVEAAKAAFSKLDEYYTKTQEINVVATILDSRHKLKYFESNGWDQAHQDYGCSDTNLIESRVKPRFNKSTLLDN